jgi:catechol 2,3-dioxygenase-like lactoylglutathione lyase family enzyme
MVRFLGLDHIVLRTPDVEGMLDWYAGVLGMETERLGEWRRGEVPFPSVRVNAGTIIDLFPLRGPDEGPVPAGRLDHFCLVVPAADWSELLSSGRVEVVRGPSRLFGARGQGHSFYTRDPDGNLVEFRHYGDGGGGDYGGGGGGDHGDGPGGRATGSQA